MPPEFFSADLSGRFSDQEAFAGAVRHAFQRAAAEGWPEIILSDASFEGWPLGETSTIHALQGWAKPGRNPPTSQTNGLIAQGGAMQAASPGAMNGTDARARDTATIAK